MFTVEISEFINNKRGRGWQVISSYLISCLTEGKVELELILFFLSLFPQSLYHRVQKATFTAVKRKGITVISNYFSLSFGTNSNTKL